MELRLVRSFVAVAEELHFGRAAQRLGISQPPLTRQIQALESDLGRQLFQRGRAGVTLTEAGQVALVEAYKLLHQSRCFADAVRANDPQARPLRVGCSASAMTEILPRLLRAHSGLQRELPVILKERNGPSVIRDLLDGDIDAAVMRVSGVSPPLKMIQIATEKVVVAFPTSHALPSSASLSLRDIERIPLAIPCSRALPGYFSAIEIAFLKEGLYPVYSHECETIASLLGLVSAGLATAIVPRMIPLLDVEGIKFVSLQDEITLPKPAIVWHDARHSPAVTSLIEAARKAFAPGSILLEQAHFPS